jgi:predicted nucleic acid-binding protein
MVEVVEVGEVKKIVISDPDDDQIIACASSVNADFIISGDADILDIKEKITIPIVTSGEFLDILFEPVNICLYILIGDAHAPIIFHN